MIKITYVLSTFLGILTEKYVTCLILPPKIAQTKEIFQNFLPVSFRFFPARLIFWTGPVRTGTGLPDRFQRWTSDESEKGEIYGYLVLIKTDQGKYTQALSYYERALDIEERSLPPNHPRIKIVKQSIEIVKEKRSHRWNQWLQWLCSLDLSLSKKIFKITIRKLLIIIGNETCAIISSHLPRPIPTKIWIW